MNSWLRAFELLFAAVVPSAGTSAGEYTRVMFDWGASAVETLPSPCDYDVESYTYRALCGEPKCSWVDGAIAKVSDILESELVGQPLAVEQLLAALSKHSASLHDPSRKSLVMSFHGPTGVGKSFTHEMLSEQLFKHKTAAGAPAGYLVIDSKNYKDEKQSSDYIRKIREQLERHVTGCSQALVVVEEFELMAPGVLDVFLEPFRHSKYSAIDYSNVTFILVSNLGFQELAQMVVEARSNGGGREALDLEVLEDTLQAQLDIKARGTLFTGRIDFTVPFLPLELAQMTEIATLQLTKLYDRGVKHSHFQSITWETDVPQWVAGKVPYEGPFSRQGAPPIQNKLTFYITSPLERKLARYTASRTAPTGSSKGSQALASGPPFVHLSIVEGKIQIDVTDTKQKF